MEVQQTAPSSYSSAPAPVPGGSAPPPPPSSDLHHRNRDQAEKRTTSISFPPPPPPAAEQPPPERSSVGVSTPFAGTSIQTIRSACEISLGDYMALRERHYSHHHSSDRDRDRLAVQHAIVMSDLQALRGEVAARVKEAEAQRAQRWVLGGLVAFFIPLVRKLFRRSAHDAAEESTTDTEHAFRRSRSLIARILDSVSAHGKKSRLASVAFFVLSILYVFQCEVSLRVAKTVAKRLKRLTARIERGDGGVGRKDLDVLKGWRWRVLLI